MLILASFNPVPGSYRTPKAFRYARYRGLTPCNLLYWTSLRPVRLHNLTVIAWFVKSRPPNPNLRNAPALLTAHPILSIYTAISAIVGISEEILLQSGLISKTRTQLRTVDVFNALSIDPSTLRPLQCKFKENAADKKILFNHFDHLRLVYNQKSASFNRTIPIAKELLLGIHSLLFPGGIQGFDEKVLEDIRARGQDGYRKTWIYCSKTALCPYCGSFFPEDDLEAHIYDEHKCPSCEFSGDDSKLQDHMCSHTLATPAMTLPEPMSKAETMVRTISKR